MKLTPQQIETIARTVHAACRHSHTCDCSHKPLDERSEESLENMKYFVVAAINWPDPKDVHLWFLSEWQHRGCTYGKKKTDKTHPLLLPYNQLPETAKLNYKLLVSITRTMISHYKELESCN